jgi:ribosome-binding protein aMBF1 (putative translation factor)
MKKEMNWEDYKKRLLKKPGFTKALEQTRLEYQIAREIIKARIEKGMSQKDVAKKMKTTQSVISRVENAGTTPSISFLKRLAQALDFKLQIRFS